MLSVKTLTISFSLPIYVSEIKRWRGAFIQMNGWQDELFHNHNNAKGNTCSKNHYRYPLIQYRVFKGKAAIFAMNEGVDALQKILATSDWVVEWKGQKRHLQIEDLQMKTHPLNCTSKMRKYRIYDWLALNTENYEKWQSATNLIERVKLLEKLLCNHLLAFCYGCDWKPTEMIKAAIQNIVDTKMLTVHETKMVAFSVDFTTNLQLPPYVAIGKSVSHGFGKTRPFFELSAKKEPKLTWKKEMKEQ